MSTVLQSWLEPLPWKMQSVVIAGQRAQDIHMSASIKNVARWVRSVTQKNGDSSTQFMTAGAQPSAEDLADELQYTTMHFALHFLKVLEIIGYKHSEPDVRRKAHYYYAGVVHHSIHMHIETEAELDLRLRNR